MRDLAGILRESVDTAYELSARDGAVAGTQVKRSVLRRGRRRRIAHAAVAGATCVAVVAALPVATRALRGSRAEVAGRVVPDLEAELVWEPGGPFASDGRSVWFGEGRHEDDGLRNDVARMDLATGEVVEGPVAIARPHAIVLGDSGLWSVSWQGDMPVGGEGHPVDGVIERVDPETLARTALIEREDSAPYDVAVSQVGRHEVVWVADGGRDELLEIDARTAELVETHVTASWPASVYTSGSYVYVTSSEDSVVQRIHAVTADSVYFDVPDCANEVVHGAGSLWVADYCGDALHRIDESSRAVTASIEMADGPSHVAFADGLVWVTTERNVVRVDPATNAVVGDPVRLPEGMAQGIEAVGGSMWVSMGQGVFRLVEKDAPPTPAPTPSPAPPEDRPVDALPPGVERIRVPQDPHVLETGAGSLWAGRAAIHRVDPSTGEVVARIETGGWAEDLEFDDAAGILWALVEPVDDGPRTVVAVDPETNEVVLGPVPVATIPGAGEHLDAHDGTAWVPGPGGVVNRVDLAEGATQVDLGDDLGLEGDVHGAATGSSVLLVSGDGAVVRVDPASHAAERVEDLGGNVVAATGSGEVAWVAQQTAGGDLVLWPLDGETGHALPGRLFDAALGAVYLAEHEGTLWVTQTSGERGVVVAEYARQGEKVNEVRLPEGTMTTATAAGPSGAWVNGGRGFLYRIGPR